MEQAKFTIRFLNDLICGSFAGLANCLSGFVLDTIKVRMQTQKISMIKCVVNIVKNQGFLMLFSGIYYPLVTIPLSNAVSFGSYQFYKKMSHDQDLSFLNGLQRGMFSGVIGTSIITPVELIKCKMQISEHEYKSSRECFKHILRVEGIRGLYRGNFSTNMREIPSIGTQFASYQLMKRFFLDSKQHPELSIVESAITGGIAGIGSWINSYPQDVVKTRLQTSHKSYKKHKFIPDGGFFDCAKQIHREEGIRGFFRGFTPCMIRAVIANSAMIVAYQKAQNSTRKWLH